MLLSVSFYEYEQSKKRRSQSAVLCCAVKIISLTAMPVYLRCNTSIIFRIAEMSGFINHFNLNTDLSLCRFLFSLHKKRRSNPSLKLHCFFPCFLKTHINQHFNHIIRCRSVKCYGNPVGLIHMICRIKSRCVP